MIVAVDVGNTNIVIGIFDGDSIVYSFRLQTDTARTTDEHAATIMLLLERQGIKIEQITGMILASVVPQMVHTFSRLSKKYFNVEPQIVGPGLKTGVPIRMENPKEVGADRIVNAAAAIRMYGHPCVVVDFGTATTFDVVNRSGEYVGGLICPGVKLSAAMLHSRTAKLPEVEISRPDRVIGKNTIHSIQSGIYYGYLSLVDGILDRVIAEEFGTSEGVHLISTGGLGRIFIDDCRHPLKYEPNLTLHGLKLIYDRNV